LTHSLRALMVERAGVGQAGTARRHDMTEFSDLAQRYIDAPTYVWVIVLGGLAGNHHSGQLHMQVNRGGVVRPLARVHE
jgi:hypothetical protein